MAALSMGIDKIRVFMGLAINAIRDNDVNADAASRVRPVNLAVITKKMNVASGAVHSTLFASCQVSSVKRLEKRLYKPSKTRTRSNRRKRMAFRISCARRLSSTTDILSVNPSILTPLI